MKRRDLIHQIVVGGVTFFVLPQVLTSCSKDEDEPDPPGTGGTGSTSITVDLNANPALKDAGGSLITRSIIVINLGEGNFTALSSVCTHQGCEVGYDQAANDIKCPCHGSVYTTAGAVINGPAPRALRSYTITQEGDILTIKL